MMDSDHLLVFHTLEYCSTCGCLTQRGTMRCPECSRYHHPIIHSPAPEPIAQDEQTPPPREVDSTFYSMNPTAPLAEEEFEETDAGEIVDWSFASTDFREPDNSD